MSDQVAIGIDLGGTTFEVGLLTAAGELLDSASHRTPRQSAAAVLDAIEAAGRDLLANHPDRGLAGVGIGVPGHVVPETGEILNCPNLQVMNGVNAGQRLSAAFGCPAHVANDAFCATLAELRCGAGRGVQNLLLLTLGTGVGGGVALDGKVRRGPRQLMGEIGHMTIVPGGRRCGCGSFGCLEAMAAKQAMIDNATERLQTGRPSLIDELTGGDDSAITPRIIAQAAQQGDRVAGRVIDQTGHYVGLAICNAILLVDPDLVLIGGGIAATGEILFEAIRRTVKHVGVYAQFDVSKILPAALGNEAGVYGAAALVWE
jgi:glucokinase